MTPKEKLKRLPRLHVNLGKNIDGYSVDIHRDKIGNLNVLMWKSGVGFKDDQFKVSIKHRDIKKIINWLTKVLEYTERK